MPLTVKNKGNKPGIEIGENTIIGGLRDENYACLLDDWLVAGRTCRSQRD